jgi:hypothetical protein
MASEKRAQPRQDLHWDSLIVKIDGSIVDGCTMVDVSSSGARLIVKAPAEVPDEFDLLLSRNGSVRRRCKVMRRSDEEVGVQFLHPHPAVQKGHRP